MALDLIDRFRSRFEPERYEDTYRRALLRVVRQKQKGKEVHAEPRTDEGEPVDLLAALRESVEAHSRKTKRPQRRAKRTRRKAAA